MKTFRKLSTRRTTIFRSSRTAGAAALLLAPAVALTAQEIPRADQASQRATAHVVVYGETLWDLAQRYLGDPFLWPQIYRLNTSVVEDPHWIFPGEELRLVPAAETVQTGLPQAEPLVEQLKVEVTPPTPVAPAPPPTEMAPTIFLRDRSRRGLLMSGAGLPAHRYRPVRRGEFYSSGFLTEGQALPWVTVLGAVGRPVLRNLTASSAARIFGQVELRAPESATYQVGDSLLVARLAREVGDWGHVVVPTGIVRISSVAGTRARADVIAQFGRVADGQFALPSEPFDDPGNVVPVPIANGVMGEIVTTRDVTALSGPQDIVFIDLGRTDGVTIGDVFEVLRSRDENDTFADAPWEAVAVLQIVHVRERSASGIVVAVSDLGVEAGAPVRLVRKMPS